MTLDILISLAGIALCVAAFFFFNWRANKPNDTPEPRMIPWRILSFAPVVLGLMIVAHLMGLAGIETGPGKSPLRF